MNDNSFPQSAAARPPVLRGLLYRSRANITRAEFEASGAVAAFAARNARLHLGGYLHFEDGTFYQFLEGAPDPLQQVWQEIQVDPRHAAVTLLSDGVTPVRRFGRWAMGYNHEDEQSLFDWTARSGLSLKGPGSARIILAFLEYISGAAVRPA